MKRKKAFASTSLGTLRIWLARETNETLKASLQYEIEQREKELQ